MARRYPSRFPRVPYQGIEFHVGKLHAGTPDPEVACEYAHRANRSGATRREIVEIVRYALAVHSENRDLYRRVSAGRI